MSPRVTAMSRFGKTPLSIGVRTLPASAPPGFERREGRLLSHGPETVPRAVVSQPPGPGLPELAVCRQTLVDLELRDVEAVVDRLGEIGDPVRVDAVERPPAGVVVGQRPPEAVHARLEELGGGCVAKAELNVPRAPQRAHPAVEDVARRAARSFLED